VLTRRVRHPQATLTSSRLGDATYCPGVLGTQIISPLCRR